MVHISCSRYDIRTTVVVCMHCYHHWYLSGELSHVLLTSGDKQCCFEHYLLHWSGDLTGMSAPYHHILLIVRVSILRRRVHVELPTTGNCATECH